MTTNMAANMTDDMTVATHIIFYKRTNGHPL
jgi:hypothetical protein